MIRRAARSLAHPVLPHPVLPHLVAFAALAAAAPARAEAARTVSDVSSARGPTIAQRAAGAGSPDGSAPPLADGPAGGAGLMKEPHPPQPRAGSAARARPEAPPARLTIHDCDTRAGHSVSTHAYIEPSGVELIVLGVYESRGDRPPGVHLEGTATVRVRRTAPHVLVLSSYEPAFWVVDAMPEHRIERIVLAGHHRQRAAVPPGVEVVNRSGPDHRSVCAYRWPGDRGGCNTGKLALDLHELTSREITAFAGCYRASEFTVEDGARQESPSAR